MPLPIPVRRWQFQVNQTVSALGSSLSTNRRLLRSIKNSLLGTGSWTNSAGGLVTSQANWTVSGSSDSVTSGMDSVDRWTVDSDLDWSSASVRSWIVLRQAGISSKFELLIHLNNSNDDFALLAVSPVAGFGSVNGGTDGSTSAAPTATDQMTLVSSTVNTWGGGGNNTARYHVMKSVDGSSNRVVITRNTNLVGFWIFDVPRDPVTGWTSPSVSMLRANSSTGPAVSAISYDNLTDVADARGHSTATMNLNLTGEADMENRPFIGEDLNVPSDVTNLYSLLPIGIYCDTAGRQGRHGFLADLWWVAGNLDGSNGPNTFPASGTLKRFMQLGPLCWPWNRSTPV